MLLLEKLYQLIAHRKMKKISKEVLKRKIETSLQENNFNLYTLAEQYADQ